MSAPGTGPASWFDRLFLARGFSPVARFGLVSAVLCAVVLLFFWPGVAHYDTVAQYQQVVSGAYYDWHPPAMARLWSVFHASGWAGQGPMFLLQTVLYWIGLGLVAAALARGARIAAVAVLVLGLWPPALGWQAVVVKDGQMAAALLAATGLVAWKRLAGKPLGAIGTAALVVLLGYAVLVRSNAIFAVAPLAVGLFAPRRWQEWRSRFLLIGAATVAMLALSPAINHGLLGAEASGVEATQPIFDMAGIAHRAGPDAVPLLPPETRGNWRPDAATRRSCGTYSRSESAATSSSMASLASPVRRYSRPGRARSASIPPPICPTDSRTGMRRCAGSSPGISRKRCRRPNPSRTNSGWARPEAR